MINIINFVIVVTQAIEYAAYMHSVDVKSLGGDRPAQLAAQQCCRRNLMDGKRIAIHACRMDLAEYMAGINAQQERAA